MYNYIFVCSDPNNGPHTVDVQWPEYDPATSDYMLLGLYPEPKQMVQETDRMDKFTFFTETWPTMLQQRSSNYDIRDMGMTMCHEEISLKTCDPLVSATTT